MQKKYNGCSTVIEYDRKSEAGTLDHPAEPGYKSRGHYKRYAVDENGVKRRIKVRRNRIKKPRKGFPLTISYLPKMFCPYRKHPIGLMNRILVMWKWGERNVDVVIDEISRAYDRKSAEAEHDLVNLTRAQLRGIKEIYEGALRKYRIWRDLTHSYGLDRFTALCARNNHEQALAIDTRYYEANGGRFLFGNASPFPRPARPSGSSG